MAVPSEAHWDSEAPPAASTSVDVAVDTAPAADVTVAPLLAPAPISCAPRVDPAPVQPQDRLPASSRPPSRPPQAGPAGAGSSKAALRPGLSPGSGLVRPTAARPPPISGTVAGVKRPAPQVARAPPSRVRQSRPSSTIGTAGPSASPSGPTVLVQRVNAPQPPASTAIQGPPAKFVAKRVAHPPPRRNPAPQPTAAAPAPAVVPSKPNNDTLESHVLAPPAPLPVETSTGPSTPTTRSAATPDVKSRLIHESRGIPIKPTGTGPHFPYPKSYPVPLPGELDWTEVLLVGAGTTQVTLRSRHDEPRDQRPSHVVRFPFVQKQVRSLVFGSSEYKGLLASGYVTKPADRNGEVRVERVLRDGRHVLRAYRYRWKIACLACEAEGGECLSRGLDISPEHVASPANCAGCDGRGTRCQVRLPVAGESREKGVIVDVTDIELVEDADLKVWSDQARDRPLESTVLNWDSLLSRAAA